MKKKKENDLEGASPQDERGEECSVCQSEFDLDAEGGITGDLGMIPLALCPWCLSGIVGMVFTMYPDAEEFQDQTPEEANQKAAKLIEKERTKR